MSRHRIASRSPLALMAALLATTALAPSHAADVFIGTITVENGRLILERCDAARNTYALRDAEGFRAVAMLRTQTLPQQGFWYGEVVGDYVQVDGGDGLAVTSIDRLEAGRSCHLSDAL